MLSARHIRRRGERKSFCRHQLRLEGLEKRYALDADPILLSHAGLPDGVGYLADAAPVAFNEDIIFAALGTTGNELWITDGSSSGTSLLKSFDGGVSQLSSIRNITRVDDQVFFTAYDNSSGREIWVTDGTADGTRLAIDVLPGGSTNMFGTWVPNSSEAKYLTATENGLFFVADMGGGGMGGGMMGGDTGGGERVFRYDLSNDFLSPLLHADGSEIVLYNGSSSSNETVYGTSHSLANDSFGNSSDALINGELLSDGRHLYLSTPNPLPTGGWSALPYDWIRYDTATGQTSVLVDNPNHGYEFSVGARAAFQQGIYFQLSSSNEHGIYVVRKDNPVPRKVVDLPVGTSIHRLTQHEDWIYAEVPWSDQSHLTAQEIIRFRLNGGSYETVAEVVPSEGSLPDDRILRGLRILGSTENGLLFVEGVQTTSGTTFDSTITSLITLRAQASNGEIVDIQHHNSNSISGMSSSMSLLRPDSLYSWQNCGVIENSVFFKATVTEEVPMGGGGMGGGGMGGGGMGGGMGGGGMGGGMFDGSSNTGDMGGGMGGGSTIQDEPAGGITTVSVQKLFVSDGSARGTFEVVSKGFYTGGGMGGNAWRVGAINNKLLFENYFIPPVDSVTAGIYSLQPRGTDTPYLNSLPDLAFIENSSEQTVPLSGIVSSGTNQKPLRIAALSSNTGLIPNPSVAYSSPDTTGNLSFTPVADQFGTATITVTVEDGGTDNNLATSGDNKTFSRSFDITVNSSNQLPTATTLSNGTISETVPAGTLVGTFETTDPDLGDTFSYSLVSGLNAPINENFIISGNALLTNSEFGSSGFQTIRVRSTDQEGRWIETVFGINILEANPPIEPPTLDVLADIAIAEDAGQQFISLTGISAGGGMGSGMGGLATVQLFATSSNTDLVPHPTATLNPWGPSSTGSLTFSPTPDASGTTTITVTVENGQNASVSREFTVTVMPVNDSPTMNELENPVWYGDEFHDKQVTFTVGGITAGGEEHTQPLRVHATSSNPALVTPPASQLLPSPTVFPPEPLLAEVTYVIRAGHSGLSTITVTIEDGGLDNNLGTPDDNKSFIRQSNVMVLLIISDPHGETTDRNPKLSRDDYFKIYVDGQPVMLNNEGVPSEFNGFNFIRAESGPANALLLKPSAAEDNRPTHRLLTDETWRINGIFNSLQNASSPVLDVSAREVSRTINIVAVAGAYEINSVNNPTLVVRRGQTYTFNLNTGVHRFWLQTTGSGYQSANVYDSEFTGNSQTTGEHQWVVPQDAPDEIFYQCEFHPVMFGKIIVVD